MSELMARFAAFRERAPLAVPAQAPPAPAALPAGLWTRVATAAGSVPVRDDCRPVPFAADLRGPWPRRIAGAELGPPGDWRWVDLETTGLRGARAFLAGVARLQGDHLAVRQFLLEDLDREPALLSAVLGELAGASALVSFNGKSFDLPVLGDRAVVAGLDGVPPLPHWDLLHPARRLWGPALGGCALDRLQAEVLGQPRGDDVAGECIPALYARWLDGDRRALDGVCAHNREDLFALAGLAARMCALLADGPGQGMPPEALWGLGRLYERAGEPEGAVACYLGCRQRRATLAAALLLKRQGKHAAAVPLWEAERAAAMPSLEAAVELAKYLEHRRRDPAAALGVVQQALRLGPWLGPERRGELEHRLQRLRRKAGAQGGGPS